MSAALLLAVAATVIQLDDDCRLTMPAVTTHKSLVKPHPPKPAASAPHAKGKKRKAKRAAPPDYDIDCAEAAPQRPTFFPPFPPAGVPVPPDAVPEPPEFPPLYIVPDDDEGGLPAGYSPPGAIVGGFPTQPYTPAVPEPATWLGLAAGLATLLWRRG